MKINKIASYAILASTLLFTACGGAEKKEEKTPDTTTANKEVTESLKKALVEAPKPSELPYKLKSTGADFIEKLPNSPSEGDKYKTTNFKASLNLGVYATDLGYLSAHAKVQNALDYVKVIKSLGDKVGATSALDAKLQERFEKNLKNVDSLSVIIDGAVEKVDTYLKNNQQAHIATLVATGSFVEGLYVATQIISTYPKNLLPEDAKNQILAGLVKLVVDQEKVLKDLISALNSLEKDADIKELTGKLEELQKVYKDLNVNEKMEKKQGSLLLVDTTIQGITKKVKEIREIIVK